MLRLNKKVALIVTSVLGVLFLFITIEKSPTIKQIAEKTRIEFPENADLVFYKRTLSYNSDVIYIRFRLKKDVWADFIKKEIFYDAREGDRNNNAFSHLNIEFENWKPREVNKSLSGTFYNKGTFATYLFDIQNNLWTDCYFAIYRD